ncbi:MAG: MGMT family protein [Candidatus Taylorbacteria bacterium]|nr:MGMT family protein [Candidatus Taylorbacteria bacterium]
MVDRQLSFKNKVFAVVKKIPKGSVLTYKGVALLAGSPRAFRAVGSILKTNFNPKIPCHRVIKSDGSVGDYNRGGSNKKRLILKGEGVQLKAL